jgi:peptide deformylase
MPSLEIKKYPDPILKKKCDEIKEITPEIKELIFDMMETIKKNQGIGLSAPQVGVLKRIIIIETKDGPKVFINPEIFKKSKEQEIEEEGCLSFPGLYLKIKRAREVLLKAKNIDGKDLEIQAKGILARIFQHEIDHLEGILFIDYLNFWQRLKFKYKLRTPPIYKFYN